MTTSDKHYVLSDRTAKMDITYKRLQKLISSYKMARRQKQKQGIELWIKVQPKTLYTAKPINMLICTDF